MAGRVNLKSIALPTEHGGWGFLAEPILLGVMVAPSWQGLTLGLAVVSLFLLHQPLKIALKDNLKHRRVPRTHWAERFAAVYGGIGITLVLLLVAVNGIDFLMPMIVGSIFALVQVFYDARNQSRELLPELCGAIALASAASSMALLTEWKLMPALMLWLILSARALTAIVYVRVRLRMAYGKAPNRSFVLGLHLIVTGIFVILAFYNLIPYLAAVAMLILTVRAFKGILFPAAQVTPKLIGFTELAFGIVYVLVVAVGYWMML